MKIQAKYDKIGFTYNETRCADSYITERLLHHLSPLKNKLYVDLGCGTGNYTIALHNKGIDFIGIDPSVEMLEKAKNKCDTITWNLGHAENFLLEDNSIDGVLATLTIHHWSNLLKALQNIYRILKPDSTFVIFTSTPKQMKGYWLNHYFLEMMKASIAQMPTLKSVTSSLGRAGFKIEITEQYFVKDDLQDMFLYAGKHRSELYLNPLIRRGISSFSALANREEVKHGLKRLEDDIRNGTIKQIMSNYKNDDGDYLFIKATT